MYKHTYAPLPPPPPKKTQLLEATHLGGFRLDATVANRLVGALLDQQCLDHADRCVVCCCF